MRADSGCSERRDLRTSFAAREGNYLRTLAQVSKRADSRLLRSSRRLRDIRLVGFKRLINSPSYERTDWNERVCAPRLQSLQLVRFEQQRDLLLVLLRLC